MTVLLNYQQFGSVGGATKASIKAGPADLFSLRVTNNNAAVRFFQLHNKVAAPAATDVPLLSWKIPAGTATAPGILQLDTNHFAPSFPFPTGLGWAISTTAAAFTDAATGSEHDVDVNYV